MVHAFNCESVTLNNLKVVVNVITKSNTVTEFNFYFQVFLNPSNERSMFCLLLSSDSIKYVVHVLSLAVSQGWRCGTQVATQAAAGKRL